MSIMTTSGVGVPVEDLGDLSFTPVQAVHAHVFEWVRTGRVPGTDIRWQDYVCACGERERR